MKLLLLLVVFSVIALQESSATSRFRLPQFRLPQFRLPQFRLPQFRLPQFRLPNFRLRNAGGDVVRNIDENGDGFLDEAELSKHLNERDIAELLEALREVDVNLDAVDVEFNNN